jgi:hypothetical protein
MKATIQNLRRVVERGGGKLEYDGIQWGVRIYQAVAPDGFHWNDSGGYHLVIQWVPGDVVDQRDTFADVVNRVADGLHPMDYEERRVAGELTEAEELALAE